MNAGRLWAAGIAAVVLAIACSPSPIGAGISASETINPITKPFAPGAYDTWFPVDISPSASEPNCGFPADWKLTGRIDLPIEKTSGVWTFGGCIASPGKVLYDVALVLTFPGGETVARTVLEKTNRDSEARFVIEVHRSSVVGAEARMYFNEVAKGS
jgi:hypothetical protein